MDYYGTDRKLSELGEQDLEDFLDQDMFTPPVNDPSMEITTFGLADTSSDDAPMDSEWLDNFFDDPVLNDRMMTEALQPRRVQSEHSYSLTNGEVIVVDGQIKAEISEKDVEGDLLGSAINPNMTLTPAVTMTTAPANITYIDTTTSNQGDNNTICIKQEPAYNSHEITMATNSIATTQQPVAMTTTTTQRPSVQPHPQTLLKQPTIILATGPPADPSAASSVLPGESLIHTVMRSNSPAAAAAHSQAKHDRLVLPKVNIKVEPYDSSSNSSSPEHTTMYDSIGLPPTPPSSSNSDSEGGLSPQRSAPPSPIRHSQLLRQQAHTQHTLGGASAMLSQPLFSSPIPSSGILMLSEEEKRTLVAEGYPIPNKLPLTKQEEKNLKKIRRKIKNKISAQESRRKKKEYLETLEKKVEAYNSENTDLRKKVELLETNNRSLIGQLQKLQSLVSKCPRPPTPSSTQTGTCLMVMVLFFAVFMGTWSPLTWSIGYGALGSGSAAIATPTGASLGAAAVAVGNLGSGQVMGPDALGPVSDSYTTPNQRSRVLMSVLTDDSDTEPTFGPPTPVDYKTFFSRWFSGESEACSHGDGGGDFTMAAPVPEVANVVAADGDGETIELPGGDMSVNYTARVMTAPRHVNTTAA